MEDSSLNICQNLSNKEKVLFDRLRKGFIPLYKITNIVCGLTPYRLGKGTPPQTKEIVKNKAFDAQYQVNNNYRQYIMGRDFKRYTWQIQESRWLKYGDWLAEPRYKAPFNDKNKIVVRQTADSIIANLDDKQFLDLKNVHNIKIVDEAYSYLYILCLLNSRLITWWYRGLIPEKGRVFAEVKVVNLKKLPIRTIDFSKPKEKDMHDRMVSLVEQILDMNKKLQAAKTDHEKKMLQRQIDFTDKQIDTLVYELYG